MRWANECNPTLDPPVTPEARTDDRGRQLAPSLREARERRAELAIAPGRGQIQALAANIYDRANQRRKRTLEALARLLDGLAPLRGRKAVLLVSEGFILEPGLPEARRVAAASARANAPVYFIDARGTTGLDPLHSAESGTVLEGRDQGGFRDAQDHLADGAVSVAVETGGRAERGDLGAALERVARESTAYYLLGYHPTSDSRDPRFRKIRIETTRPGTSVLARPGYFPASAPADAASDSLDLRVRAGLDLAAAPAGVPTRLAAFVLGPAAAGKTRALLLAEADPRELGLQGRAATGLRGTLDTYALVVSRETGAVFPLMQRIEVDARIPEDAARDIGWLAVPREFELLPGTYQARFVVRGPGGRVGAVEHAFVVPPSGLRIATPVITDTAPLTDGRLALTARTLLRPSSGTLYCQFQVYGGTRDPATGEPRVSARYAIRHADGSPLAVGDAFEPLSPGADGAPARVFEIPLTGARSGSYRLTLEVRDQVSGQIRERQESFELALEPASQP
jgi:hypothetical protein